MGKRRHREIKASDLPKVPWLVDGRARIQIQVGLSLTCMLPITMLFKAILDIKALLIDTLHKYYLLCVGPLLRLSPQLSLVWEGGLPEDLQQNEWTERRTLVLCNFFL